MASRRLTAAMPVAAVSVAVAATAAGIVLAVWARAGGTGDRSSAWSLAATIALFAVMGAVVALARPQNRVGWVMVGAAAVWALGEGIFDAGVRGITAAGDSPAAGALALAGAAVRAPGWLATAAVVPAIFPDGRLPGPRWRWLGWVLAAAITTTCVGTALDPHVESDQLAAAGWRNPLPLPGVVGAIGNLLAALSLPLLAATVIGSVAAMVVRFRRGDTALRRQLLTFAAAAAFPVIVIPTAFGAGAPAWLFAVAVLPLPVAVAAAVLTGGLFDLATVANRSLVWGGLSLAVVAVYALIVAGTGELLGQSGARWLPWLGTAVVAVSFSPLRGALQSAANRITYGAWREPYRVLADLSPRIGAAPDTERLLADVVAELHTTLGLTGAALRDPGGHLVAGSPDAAPAVIALTAYGRHAGELLFTEPVTPLRASDRRVLDDLAAQLALLMHARALTDDLRRARERLVLAREDERRRLRRDLHDGLGSALAGLMLKADNARALVRDDPDRATADLVVLRSDLQSTVVDVRRLVEGLRPPAIDELGLTTALTQAVRRLASPTGTAVDIDVAAELPPVPAAVEVAVYRIVCEAVTNAIRHASASTCLVEVRVRDGRLVAAVRDDGTGFADGGSGTGLSGGSGIATMRERAEELGGTVTIHSGRSGTHVCAELPLPPPASAAEALVPLAGGERPT